jgi:hypothetical protein
MAKKAQEVTVLKEAIKRSILPLGGLNATNREKYSSKSLTASARRASLMNVVNGC